jgi:hypothetical protein
MNRDGRERSIVFSKMQTIALDAIAIRGAMLVLRMGALTL